MNKSTTIIMLLILSLCGTVYAQNERPIEELLEVLSQNHMGSVTDVFSLEELQIIKEHFVETTFPSNNESILLDTRYATTQSVAQVQAADIDPSDVTNVDILANSPIQAFPGAGVHLRGPGSGIPGPPRIIIVDDDGNLWQRDEGANPISITNLGKLTGIPEGHSITGTTVITSSSSNAAIYGISTNGTDSVILFTISPDDMTVTEVASPNGLVLPISLSLDGMGNLITIDIDTDIVYQIDNVNGLTTPVGPLGYDANFGQGLFYDDFNDQIVSLAYNPAVGDSQRIIINPFTGSASSFETIDPGTQQQFGWGDVYDRDAVTGIEENGIDGFSFYPNPAQEFISLKANNTIEKIEVYSVLGQLVLEKAIQTNRSKVDISHLVSGAYMLKVSTSDQSGVYKLLKR